MEERVGVWRSTKTYTYGIGLSCSYRNWKADSHCRFLHGYPLQVTFTFETTELDVRNFAVDFGGLKSLKGWLEDTFDHKCLIATDDPEYEWYREGYRRGTLDMVTVPKVSCEAFAEMIYEYTEQWLIDAGFSPRCMLASVEVREHESNSAIYFKR